MFRSGSWEALPPLPYPVADACMVSPQDLDDCSNIFQIITMILKGGHLNRRAAATLVDGGVRLSTKVVLCQHFEKLNLLSHFMSG